jgi:hypothetical protein
MLTERTIINALIILASFILVPFIISESLSVDYLPAICVVLALGLIVAFFYLKEMLSMCPLLGNFVAGTLNFLPIPLGAPQVSAILLILYYITGYVIIRQRPIKLGKPEFLWPIVIVVGIVLYHVHTMSLGSLGGSTEGARPAFFIYLFTIAYFCGINMPTPSVSFLAKLPYWALVCTVVSSIPYLLSTYIPALAPYFYTVTNNVNVEAYFNTEGGTEEAAGAISSKLAAFGPIGAALQLYLLAHYPIGTWFSPSRLWVVCLSFMCVVLVVCCGYRSELFSFAILTVAGAWCYYSWRALVLPTAIVIFALVMITASTDNIIHLPLNKLPMIAQRTMSFLPGDWDEEAIESGKGSNEFRQNIENVYLSEYVDKSPLFGTGFDIDKAEFDSLNETLNMGGGADRIYLQAKLFIVGKMYHTGWISVFDCVGAVGMLGFIALQLTTMLVTARFLRKTKADTRSSLYPLYVWIQMNLVSGALGYYTVFGSFNDALVNLLIYCVILSHLSDLEKATEPTLIPGGVRNPIEMGGLTGASYGERYGSRYGK